MMPEHSQLTPRIDSRTLAALLLAAGLLFNGLAAESLWGDEIFTAIFAAKPFEKVINFTADDIHPPLYYLLAGLPSRTPLWPQGTPGAATDWLWRWPSVMMGVLAVAATYRLGALLGDKRIGQLAALLLAVAPVAIKYGQEARMHALFMALSVTSTLLLALALKTGRKKYWIGYALATTLNLYTMYFAFIIVTVHGFWVLAEAIGEWRTVTRHLLTRIKASQIITFAVATGIALLAYLPWWPVLLNLLAYRAGVGAVEGGVGSPWAFLPKVIRSIGPFGGGDWLFFGLYLTGLWAARRKRPSSAVLGGLWLLIPAILPLALGDSRALHLRYAFVLPVYLIFVALAVRRLADFIPETFRRRTFAVTGAALVALSLIGVSEVVRQQKPDWRGAASFVASQAGPADVIVTGPLWDDTRFFGYYYPRPDQVMPPPTLAFRQPGITAEMAAVEGRLWLVTRYPPDGFDHFTPHPFYGVTVFEQTRLEYDPVRIIEMGANLCKQAARNAFDWAALMEAGGVLNPDPRSSQAAAYLCQGDTYAVIGDYERAVKPYQKMVEAFPGWAGGYATLAKTYLEVDNLPAALENFALAVKFNPDWQGVTADEAARLAAEGKLNEAAAVYKDLLD